MRQRSHLLLVLLVAGVLWIGEVVAAQLAGAPPAAESASPSVPVPAKKTPPPSTSTRSVSERPPAFRPAPSGDRTETKVAPTDQKNHEAKVSAESARDPTLPGPELREWLDSAKPARDLPTIELKGRVLGGQQPGTAILEVDKMLRVVREGDELSLGGVRPGGVTVRVVEVSQQQVRLEIKPSGRNLTLY
jgi:hypothetical protein